MKHASRTWGVPLVIFLLLFFLVGLGCGGDDASDDDDDNDSAADDDDDDTGSDDDDDDNDDDNDTGSGDDDDDNDTSYPEYPNDELLHLNHLQALGTHNSYHIEPQIPFHPSHRYTHKPLDEQLTIGVRQFELDLQWSNQRGLQVFHIPVVDQLSTCDTFVDCLGVIKSWSDFHPGHHTLLVFLEPKDDLHINNIHEHTADVEQDILSVWPVERILTPDDVRGEFATLQEAILTDGWPTLGETRDRIIFHAHSHDEFLDNYHAAYPGLQGALMFADSNPSDSHAAIMPMNNPIGGADEILEAVQAGFIVRTMAGSAEDRESGDYSDIEAALPGGAHFISTDFPEPVGDSDYFLEIPGGTPSRCNPITAPDFCVSEDIENLLSR